MAHSDEEWRRRFREAPEVPFTDDLRHRILAKAEQELSATGQPEPRSRHGSTWRSLWVCLAGLGGAAALVWAVWTYSVALPPQPATSGPTGVTQEKVQLLSDTGQPASGRAYGLQRAPISIGDLWIGTAPGLPPDSVVYATLTNVGTKPLGPQDVIGVLAFHPRGSAAMLGHSDWLAFVSGPSRTLQPGDMATWSFRPLGAPTDANHRLTEVPSLEFYSRGLVPVERADVVWRIPAGLRVTDVRVTPHLEWASGQSVEVSATLENRSEQAVDSRTLLALIWFAPQPDPDWTRPDVIRFLNRVQVESRDGLVPPGGRAQLDFRLIGPPKVDFRKMAAGLALVKR